MPWQAGADVHADGHVHSAFGPERLLKVLNRDAPAMHHEVVPELRPEDDTGYRHECKTGLNEWMERVGSVSFA